MLATARDHCLLSVLPLTTWGIPGEVVNQYKFCACILTANLREQVSVGCQSVVACTYAQLSPFYHLPTLDVTYKKVKVVDPLCSTCN